MSTISLKNALGKVYFKIENRKNHVYSEWIGFADQEEAIQAVTQMVSFIQNTPGVTRVVSDNTHWEGAWSLDLQYLQDVWIKGMENSGVKWLAHILSPDVFGAISAIELEDSLSTTELTMKLFQNVEKGIQWLDEQQSPLHVQ